MKITNEKLEKIDSKDEKIIIKLINLIIKKDEIEYPQNDEPKTKAIKKTIDLIKEKIEEYKNENSQEFQEIDLEKDIISRKIKKNDFPNHFNDIKSKDDILNKKNK